MHAFVRLFLLLLILYSFLPIIDFFVHNFFSSMHCFDCLNDLSSFTNSSNLSSKKKNEYYKYL